MNREGTEAAMTWGDAMKLTLDPSTLIDVVMDGTKNACLKIIGEKIIASMQSEKAEAFDWLNKAYKEIEERV